MGFHLLKHNGCCSSNDQKVACMKNPTLFITSKSPVAVFQNFIWQLPFAVFVCAWTLLPPVLRRGESVALFLAMSLSWRNWCWGDPPVLASAGQSVLCESLFWEDSSLWSPRVRHNQTQAGWHYVMDILCALNIAGNSGHHFTLNPVFIHMYDFFCRVISVIISQISNVPTDPPRISWFFFSFTVALVYLKKPFATLL